MSVNIWNDVAGETEIYEENGVITGARRVTIIKATYIEGVEIGDILIGAMAQAGVPQAGEALAPVLLPDVVVTRRTPRYVGRNSDGQFIVRIECIYELKRAGLTAQVPLRGSSSLTMVQTEADKDGNPIVVVYGGVSQGVQINAPVAEQDFQREIIIETDNPDATQETYINHVNSAAFRGKAAGLWLCTLVSYEPFDLTAGHNLYKFLFSFHYNPDGYRYRAVYRNSDGTLPSDLVEGVGKLWVDWHDEVDFTTLFG